MILKFLAKSAALLAMSGMMFAGSIDGRWKLEPLEGQAKESAKGKSRTMTLDLKSSGNQLTGSLSAGKKRNTTIEKGSVDGDNFSFVTKTTTKKGERIQYWKGTVEGDQLKLTHSAKEGAKRGQALMAKRAA